MKFRNATSQALLVPALGVTVEPGDTTPDLDDEQAAGFIGQADVWSAVGKEAKSAQKEATTTTPDEGDGGPQ